MSEGGVASSDMLVIGSQQRKIPKRTLGGGASQQHSPSHGPPVMGTQDRSEQDAKKRRSDLEERTKRKRRESEARKEMAKAIKVKEGATCEALYY